jgi:integrase
MRRDFTAKSLIEKVNTKNQLKNVGDMFLEQIQQLKEEERRGYMLSVKQVYNSLLKFNKHLDIYFSDIDINWLKRYEAWLKKEGTACNTIGIRLRTLRAVYNIAIEKNIVKAEYYPFKEYKVSKLHKETVKRAISKADINKILHYQSSNKYTSFSIDLFAFTYYAGGINFVDIAYLTKDNIINDKLTYIRRKTGKLIKVPLQPQAIGLIKKYENKNSPYLFPVLFAYHRTEQQKANRVHKVITYVNKRLKAIGEKLKIPITLTTYVARHSQATIMKKAGVPTSVICEIMGHSSEKVTQIYLDSFDNEQVDEAMKNLL